MGSEVKAMLVTVVAAFLLGWVAAEAYARAVAALH